MRQSVYLFFFCANDRQDLQSSEKMTIIDKIKDKLTGHHHDETVQAGAASGAATGMGLETGSAGIGHALSSTTGATGTAGTVPTGTTTTTTTTKKSHLKRWKPDMTYNVGDRVRFHGKVYESLLQQTSTAAMTPFVDSVGWRVVSDYKSSRPMTTDTYDAVNNDSSSSSDGEDDGTEPTSKPTMIDKMRSMIHH